MMKIKNKSLLIIIFFLVLIIMLTWPLILNLNGFLLPKEYEDVSHSDSFEHISKINETKQLLSNQQYPVVTDKSDVSTIYIFSGVMLTGLGLSDITFHNLYFLIAYFLAGYFTYLFVKELTNDDIAALFAGFLFVVNYYVPYAYFWGHSNTMQVQWIPLVFLMLEKMLKHNEKKYAFYLGFAFALQVLSGTYHVVHMSFMIPFYIVVRAITVNKKFLLEKEFWINSAISATTAFLLSGFYLIKKLGSEVIMRTLEENMRNYWRLNSLRKLLYIDYHLYIGIVQLLLFGIGCYFVFRNVKKHKKYLPYVVMAFFVLLLIIGPFSVVSPYYWLFKLWPYFDHLRVPFRMYPFFLLPVSLIASLLLTKLKKKKIIAMVILILLVLITNVLFSPWYNHHMFFP